MGDKQGEEDGKQQEKRLFTIPSAKDIARLEHGKSKVKSYFKSQFGKKPTTAQSKDQATSSNRTNASSSSASTLRNQPNSKVASTSSDSRIPNVTSTATVERTSRTVGDAGTNGRTSGLSTASDLKVGASSAYPGTEPSTCGMPDGAGVGTKRKIGSAFADKFSALREGADYEEPQLKRAAVSTAVVAAPIATSAKAPSGANTIVVNTRQKGNPILKHIRNIPWEFGDIVPDYVMGRTACALYLSLRYHHLNPNYIHDRLKDLGHQYELRVLLVQVDVKDPHHSVKELARMALLADCTLILAWSAEEAGRYLETYKSYENKSADALKEKIETDYLSKVTDVLSTVRSVNKTDVVTLVSTFGTFDKILAASKEDLYLCPGFGPQKAQRLYDVLHEPFLKTTRIERKTATKDTAAATTKAEVPATSEPD
ncbi:mating-type switching protein swi10-like [Patiria miniata]|uniref:DNA excision repair protein ERCC-1 n=1 Tax=Patiria miniata TaxID=46514 RepID=A0A914B209_PATMI|nr:mating-type switching protein swi10-like [Patiria miniata]